MNMVLKYNSKSISNFHFGGGNIELYIDHKIRHSRLLTSRFELNVKYILLQSTTIKNCCKLEHIIVYCSLNNYIFFLNPSLKRLVFYRIMKVSYIHASLK